MKTFLRPALLTLALALIATGCADEPFAPADTAETAEAPAATAENVAAAEATFDADALNVLFSTGDEHGHGGMGDPHIEMSPEVEPRPGDEDKANAIALATYRANLKYRDVNRAIADGYVVFGDTDEPGVEIHYVNVWRSFLENWRIDPEQPGALLYERQHDGSLELVGAMFTAPPESSWRELNRRVPLSQARWHLHTNICVPVPLWSEAQWARTMPDGQPMFGTESPIHTRQECESAPVNGEFWPVAFGWMVHAYVFDDDPAVWSRGDGHGGH